MKSMKRTKLKDKEVNPFKTILFGFLGYVIIGVALISLPFAQKIPVGFVDNLFNVVSAMSTTGLTTGSLSDMYTPFGKIILLGLIQLGAIGYMTLTSFLILSTSKKISTHRVKILSAEFSMPENFDLKNWDCKNLCGLLFFIVYQHFPLPDSASMLMVFAGFKMMYQ